MTPAFALALVCTIFFLAISTYVLMGSVPLLVLRHDTPMDARFVRGFFATYYRLAMVTSAVAAAFYLAAGRPSFAAGALALTFVAFALRRVVVPTMEATGARIAANDAAAIAAFRRVHVIAVVANFAQLAAAIAALITISIQAK